VRRVAGRDDHVELLLELVLRLVHDIHVDGAWPEEVDLTVVDDLEARGSPIGLAADQEVGDHADLRRFQRQAGGDEDEQQLGAGALALQGELHAGPARVFAAACRRHRLERCREGIRTHAHVQCIRSVKVLLPQAVALPGKRQWC